MILTFSTTQITQIGDYYMSSPFEVDNKDSLLTVNVYLNSSGTCLIQSSIDNINWYDVEFTDFDCIPSGLQSYTECQSDLYYRLKANRQIIHAKLLV